VNHSKKPLLKILTDSSLFDTYFLAISFPQIATVTVSRALLPAHSSWYAVRIV
jgi:hypothetical protein